MAAGPTELRLATFTDLARGTRVTVALSDPDGLIIVDGRVEETYACGARIVFGKLSRAMRRRLHELGRRVLVVDDPVDVERVA
jgi:hypothetical protein